MGIDLPKIPVGSPSCPMQIGTLREIFHLYSNLVLPREILCSNLYHAVSSKAVRFFQGLSWQSIGDILDMRRELQNHTCTITFPQL